MQSISLDLLVIFRIFMKLSSRWDFCGASQQFAALCWWFKRNWWSIFFFILFFSAFSSIHVWAFLQSLGNWIESIRPLTLIFWSIAANFLLCTFGEQVSNQLDAITNAIYQCEWYLFPVEVQKMSLTAMTATQQPVIFCGFGNILLARNTFKMVYNSEKFVFIFRLISVYSLLWKSVGMRKY